MSQHIWKWYIKINLKEPTVQQYKENIENKLLNYWMTKTSLLLDRSYPKKVTYINKVNHIRLKEFYYGCLMIDFKNNLFSQIFKNFIRTVTYNLLLQENKENISSFMRGIIAGESTIACHFKSKSYAVHISAVKENERIIYKSALGKLNITAKIYDNYKEILISKRENLVQLLTQRLMTLHPRKYNKFLYMMRRYPEITKETGYFTGRRTIWNKIPKETISEIITLYTSGITRTEELATRLHISQIKVQRVLKERNFGKRLIKNSEERRKEIAQFARNNPSLLQRQIAQHFHVSQMIVSRAIRKYR